MTSRAPRAANSTAVAAPIPLAPPVTITTGPSIAPRRLACTDRTTYRRRDTPLSSGPRRLDARRSAAGDVLERLCQRPAADQPDRDRRAGHRRRPREVPPRARLGSLERLRAQAAVAPRHVPPRRPDRLHDDRRRDARRADRRRAPPARRRPLDLQGMARRARR